MIQKMPKATPLSESSVLTLCDLNSCQVRLRLLPNISKTRRITKCSNYRPLKFKAFDRRIIQYFADQLLMFFFRALYAPGSRKFIAFPAEYARTWPEPV